MVAPAGAGSSPNLPLASEATAAGGPGTVEVTDGGRHEVAVRDRVRRAVYWEAAPAPVDERHGKAVALFDHHC